MKYFARFFEGLQQDIKAFVFWCFIFSLYRAIFIFIYHDSLHGDITGEILKAMFLGLRLSLKTAGIIMLFGTVLATLPRIISNKWPSDKLRMIWHGAAMIFFAICFFARIPYYEIFNSAFNMMLVNGMHDDKYAILMTAVHQYQLLYRLPAAIVTGIVFAFFLYKFWKYTSTIDLVKLQHKKIVITIFIILLPIFWIFVRYGGAFSYAKSVNWENAARTKSNLLNEAIIDDGQALYRVYSMKRELDKVTNVDIPLHELKRKIAELNGNKDANTLSDAFKRTVKQPKLTYQPDNIVIVIGESFGLWPFLPKFEQLGLVNESLKIQNSDEGAAVRYMLPNGSGTIAAVNGVVTGLPDTSLYENYHPNSMKDKYQSGIGYIMHQLGYKTVFWYGGFSGWQNIKKFVLAQSFDEFHCADEFSYTGGNAWGCPDKVLFDNISKYIAKQSENEKVLHVVLTSSNHPPYTIDVDKEGFQRNEVKKHLPNDIDSNEETLTELGHIWYTDMCIGNFANDLKNINPKSMLVITGDHSERFSFAKEQTIETLSAIPCIFYGPGIHKEWFENTAGCHIQIAGTIAEMIAPAGFTYTAFWPDMFTGQSIFNHRLYADKDKVDLLTKNEEISCMADYARTIASWRILKGDRI